MNRRTFLQAVALATAAAMVPAVAEAAVKRELTFPNRPIFPPTPTQAARALDARARLREFLCVAEEVIAHYPELSPATEPDGVSLTRSDFADEWQLFVATRSRLTFAAAHLPHREAVAGGAEALDGWRARVDLVCCQLCGGVKSRLLYGVSRA
jgi:hypothetical protein